LVACKSVDLATEYRILILDKILDFVILLDQNERVMDAGGRAAEYRQFGIPSANAVGGLRALWIQSRQQA
jgi:hypothetical protein